MLYLLAVMTLVIESVSAVGEDASSPAETPRGFGANPLGDEEKSSTEVPEDELSSSGEDEEETCNYCGQTYLFSQWDRRWTELENRVAEGEQEIVSQAINYQLGQGLSYCNYDCYAREEREQRRAREERERRSRAREERERERARQAERERQRLRAQREARVQCEACGQSTLDRDVQNTWRALLNSGDAPHRSLVRNIYNYMAETTTSFCNFECYRAWYYAVHGDRREMTAAERRWYRDAYAVQPQRTSEQLERDLKVQDEYTAKQEEQMKKLDGQEVDEDKLCGVCKVAPYDCWTNCCFWKEGCQMCLEHIKTKSDQKCPSCRSPFEIIKDPEQAKALKVVKDQQILGRRSGMDKVDVADFSLF